MTEKELFIEILKVTPTDSIVETTGYVDYKTATELGLINFKKFMPKSVGMIFKKDSDSEAKWVDFFNKAEISDLITHYWIYNKGKIIGNGFDYPDINCFDSDYYLNSFDKFKSDFDIQFSSNLTNGLPEPNREIEFVKVSEYNANFSTEIRTKINSEVLDLRFAIEQLDFELLKSLKQELSEKDKLIFKGVYSSSSDFQELGITIEKPNIWVDLMIDSTRQLISNLIWFQQISERKEIEKLIIKSP